MKRDTPTQSATIVMLAGQEAIALREPLQKQFASHKHPVEIIAADSILETVLMSGGASSSAASTESDDTQPEDRAAAVPLVVAAISQELDQIEPAVRSLRKIYPRARIILACEPADEVLCRKAKAWGATDYLILPADPASLQRLCLLTPLPTAPPQPAPNSHSDLPISGRFSPHPAQAPANILHNVVEFHANDQADHPEAAPLKLPIRALSKSRSLSDDSFAEPQLPGLPLMAQTSLLTDLLNGRPDFHNRILATLKSYVKWNASLRFIPATITPATPLADFPTQLHHPVALPNQPPFGHLLLEPLSPDHSLPPDAHSLLSQAAPWMAAMLAISQRYEQLRSLAITDELSGAFNRRYFNKYMARLLDDARLRRFRVTLLLFDIDDFKKYNDSFGHASGDAIIRELIKILRLCTRPHDLVARLGGDEFAVVYWDNEAPRQPNSQHPKDVLSATERFREAIKNHHWPEICKIQGEVSISGGLATFPWDADTLESLMARADQALLRAKSAGKNVILLHAADNPFCQEPPAQS